MINKVFEHIDKAIVEFTKDDFLPIVLDAKKDYFERSGSVNEEDLDYELKMECFNEWYLFQYYPKGDSQKIIEKYLEKHSNLDQELKQSLKNIRHSLFTFHLTLFNKETVITDVLTNKKYDLPQDHPRLSLLTEDIFIGRLIFVKDKAYLLRGFCVFPKDAKDPILKEAKKISKLKNPHKEADFLHNLERLKSRWVRYNHLETKKIFVFN